MRGGMRRSWAGKSAWIAGAVGVIALVAGGCTSTTGGTNAAAQSGGGGGHKVKPAPAPPPPVALAVNPMTGTKDVDVAKPVTVRASHGTLASVVMTNAKGKRIAGRLSADHRTWVSAVSLGYARAYALTAVGANAAGKQLTAKSTFRTVTPATLTDPTVFPSASTGTVGIGQPIDVRFDEKIADKAAVERHLKVTTDPVQVGAWHWMTDQDVQWRPKVYWKVGTKVHVDVNLYGVNVGNNIYGQESRHVSFKIHDNWTAIGDVSKYTLTVYHNGKKVRTLPTSFGRPALPTHNGPHVVEFKYPVYYMNSASWGLPANAPGGYANFPAYWAVRISDDGEFVHVNDGTDDVQGYANVTHGCVNLSMANGKWFYDHFGSGDIVNIVGGSPQLPIDDGYGAWNDSWKAWAAGSALHR